MCPVILTIHEARQSVLKSVCGKTHVGGNCCANHGDGTDCKITNPPLSSSPEFNPPLSSFPEFKEAYSGVLGKANADGREEELKTLFNKVRSNK